MALPSREEDYVNGWAKRPAHMSEVYVALKVALNVVSILRRALSLHPAHGSVLGLGLSA